jgi:hypothetical protein
MHGQEYDASPGQGFCQVAASFDTVQQWHGYVKEDHVRPFMFCGIQQCVTVTDFPNDIAVVLKQPVDSVEYQVVIIRDQDAGQVHNLSSGTATSTATRVRAGLIGW